MKIFYGVVRAGDGRLNTDAVAYPLREQAEIVLQARKLEYPSLPFVVAEIHVDEEASLEVQP